MPGAAPLVLVRRALARIGAWQREADPRIAELQAGETEMIQLQWLAQVIRHLTDSALEVALLLDSGPVLGSLCAILPANARPTAPRWAILRSVPGEQEQCVILVAPLARLAEAERRLQGQHGRISAPCPHRWCW